LSSQHGSISSVALLLGVALAACSSAKPAAKDSATSASPILERHALDLDGDSVPDSILVLRLRRGFLSRRPAPLSLRRPDRLLPAEPNDLPREPKRSREVLLRPRAVHRSLASAAAVTYAPVIVYRLEDKPRIDSAATRALTREELGGFAGFAYRTDVAALRRGNGSKLLWSLKEQRALP
jgi:hypothetical protein